MTADNTCMYQVIHVRKIRTSAGLALVAGHNSREKIYDEQGRDIGNYQEKEKWYNPDNAGKNRLEGVTAKEINERRGSIIKKAAVKRKPQKNAAVAVEVVLSGSPEFQGDWDQYLEDSKEWALKRYGAENLLQASIHFDETTPHLHLLFVPLVKNQKGEKKYSSGEFAGNREDLQKLHTEYFEAVGKKYGLKRGEGGRRVAHQTLKEYDKEVKGFFQAKEKFEKTSRDFKTHVENHNGLVKGFSKAREDYENKQSPEWKTFMDFKKLFQGLKPEEINMHLEQLRKIVEEYRKKRSEKKDRVR